MPWGVVGVQDVTAQCTGRWATHGGLALYRHRLSFCVDSRRHDKTHRRLYLRVMMSCTLYIISLGCKKPLSLLRTWRKEGHGGRRRRGRENSRTQCPLGWQLRTIPVWRCCPRGFLAHGPNLHKRPQITACSTVSNESGITLQPQLSETHWALRSNKTLWVTFGGYGTDSSKVMPNTVTTSVQMICLWHKLKESLAWNSPTTL